jgi:hypothetical protein
MFEHPSDFDAKTLFEGIDRNDLLTIELCWAHVSLNRIYSTDSDGNETVAVHFHSDQHPDQTSPDMLAFERQSGMKVGWHDGDGWPDMDWQKQIRYLMSLGFTKIYLETHPYNVYTVLPDNEVSVQKTCTWSCCSED